MKTKLTIIIISAIFIITSCKKDDIKKTDPFQVPDTTSYFNAKLNGIIYNPDSTSASLTIEKYTWRLKIISYKDSNRIELTLFKNLRIDSSNTFALKNYTFLSDASDVDANINYTYINKAKESRLHYMASYLTISLTQYDTITKKISGTFFGNLKRPDINQTDTLIVTEGIFNNIQYR